MIEFVFGNLSKDNLQNKIFSLDNTFLLPTNIQHNTFLEIV
jgi:hypothetical protein